MYVFDSLSAVSQSCTYLVIPVVYIPTVELGRLPTLLVAVSSGRNHISKAIIKLTAPGVTYRYQDAILEGEYH
jgi:hypothetical protein